LPAYELHEVALESVLDCSGVSSEDEKAVALTFEHVGQLSAILSRGGHKEIAALLYGIGDVATLGERRRRQGRDGAVVGPSSGILDYALFQLEDMAASMDARGLPDMAILLRMPGLLNDASQARRDSAALAGLEP
jgi:hypothetical protein